MDINQVGVVLMGIVLGWFLMFAVRVRREFKQEGEGQQAADESLQGVEVGCLLPKHPADDIIGPIAETALDEFQDVERSPEWIPTLGVQPRRVEAEPSSCAMSPGPPR